MERRVHVVGNGLSVTPGAIYREMSHELFAPAAAAELEKVHGAVVDWVRNRLQALEAARDDTIALILSSYDQDGFGLQSVGLQVIRAGYPDPQAVRLRSEHKDPTIGVIAPDIIKGDSFWTLTGFQPDKGTSEVVTALSNELKMDGRQGSLYETMDEVPGVLPFGQSLRVDHPNAVRTLVQRAKNHFVQPGATANFAAVRQATNSGVYASSFLKRE